jgi:hypothetical protein
VTQQTFWLGCTDEGDGQQKQDMVGALLEKTLVSVEF